MKKIKVISTTWANKLEDELNKYVGKEGYVIKAVYFDNRQNCHVAVLEREE